MKGANVVTFLVLIGLAVWSGCGSSWPECGIVTGKITVDGQPINQGMVCFWPAAGRPATAEIQPDGTYRLTTFEPGDGATIGQHVVTIDAKRVIVKGKVPANKQEEIALISSGDYSPRDFKVQWLAPERYMTKESSGLNADVKSGENEVNFNLSGH